MEHQDQKLALLAALQQFNIAVVNEEGKMVFLEKDYTIEVEQNGLFKLSQEGYVIAPFKDLEELCQFIKTDMQLNE